VIFDAARMRGRTLLLLLILTAALASACRRDSTGLVPSDGGVADAGGQQPSNPLCVNGQSRDGAYPKAELALEMLKTIPDLQFEKVSPSGEVSPVSMHDYFEPCAKRPRVLVLRAVATWCGTCRWSAAHTSEFLNSEFREQIEWLDLLVADEDNSPANVASVPSWRALVDANVDVALDPVFSFDALNSIHEPLPYFAIVDTWSMTIQYAAGNPDPDLLKWHIEEVIASVSGLPAPKRPSITLHDGHFNRQEWELLQGMTLPAAPPPDSTNAFADDSRAAALGAKLFSDSSLSPSGAVSCATCHDASKGFADGNPQSTGVSLGDRNAPSALFAAHSRWQFWDGRADSLWMQAVGPFENEKEFDSTRLFVAHAVADRYKIEYEAIFGDLPALGDAERFPPAGKPGQPTWEQMASEDKESVTRVFANVGKSIAAFERTLRGSPNRLDEYVGGNGGALSNDEKHGAKLFLTSGCVQCHYGPRLTDDAFHVVRFPSGRQDGDSDRGRLDGVAALLPNEFNSLGRFSDDVTAGHRLIGLTAPTTSLGAFKTPPLRGVVDTAPYGHGGNLATLRDVVETYSSRGRPPEDLRAIGTVEPWVPGFAQTHIAPITEFLGTLNAKPVESQ
jgi:cytochrome c peroxidase